MGDIPGPGQQSPFDDEFAKAARHHEDDLRADRKPSKESLREVKAEAKRRKQNQKRMRKQSRRFGKRRRAEARREWAAGIAIILVVAAAIAAPKIKAHLQASGAAGSTIPIVVPSPSGATDASPTPSSTTTLSANDVVTNPFIGTQFAKWPTGAAGVAAPRAVALGSYSASKVAADYAATRAYLLEVMLDNRVLYGAQLNPVARTIQPDSLKSLEQHSVPKYPWQVVLANRFLPSEIVATRIAPKVNGYMRARLDNQGNVMIDYAYMVFYPVRERSHPQSLPVLLGVRREGTVEFQSWVGDPRPWVYESWWVSDMDNCHLNWPQPSYLPVYFDDTVASPVASNPGPTSTTSLYDVTKPVPTGEGCLDISSSK